LIEALFTQVHDPRKDRLVAAIRKVTVVFFPLLALALYAFVNWWTAAAVLLLFVARGWRWLRELDYRHRLKFRNRCTQNKIAEIVAAVKRGGFDEPTIIRHRELFDVEIPPLPKLVHVYGVPYLLGSHPTGIQEHAFKIPDVLYALLRLPRRNVESEVSKTFLALSKTEREELSRKWRMFVDRLLKYDEPALA
jgi:hypothetical protein